MAGSIQPSLIVKPAHQPNASTTAPSTPMVSAEVNFIQRTKTPNNTKKGKGKNKKPGNQQENPKPTTNDKGKRKAKYPCLLCGGDHFTKECPHHDEISKFLKSNPVPAVLTNPFPSQQQLIDHMSNQGNSNSMKEIRMMSSETITLNTHSQYYDKTVEKKDENPSSRKAPSNSSPPSSSNGPLMIEKPSLDLILRRPKATLRNSVFNPNARFV